LQVNIVFVHFKVVNFTKIIIIRACRVLRQARGHLLLIGLDGTGKTTIMGLAATISNCEMVKLNVKKGYCFTDFRDDLKAIFKIAGAQKRKVTFFIDDKDIYEVIYNIFLKNLKTKQNFIILLIISKELFLEDIDSLLSSGNIPDLFDSEELESILMEIKSDGQSDGILVDDRNELYKYFINVIIHYIFIKFRSSTVKTYLLLERYLNIHVIKRHKRLIKRIQCNSRIFFAFAS